MKMPEWLERASPADLGAFLAKEASPRKGGLFIRHLCRLHAARFTDARSVAALDAADRHEAGEVDRPQYEAAVREAARAEEEADARVLATRDPHTGNYSGPAYVAADDARVAARVAWEAEAADCGYTRDALAALRRYGGASRSRGFTFGKRALRQIRGLFFEHFGDVRRPVALDPAWRTGVVVGVARAAYDDRLLPSGELDTARLGVLADALEEAGCADDSILSHLRGPGPHVRGCWAVDLCLGLG